MSAPRRGVPRALAVVLTAVLVATLLAGGGLALARAHELRSISAADNRALVDTAATEEVGEAVSSALTRILTYDHADPDTTRAAAEEVLVGDAQREYDQLFEILTGQAAGQQLTLRTTVGEVGVERLGDDSAELLVFLDQSSTRATDGASSVAAAQVAVTATRTDDGWKVSGLDPL